MGETRFTPGPWTFGREVTYQHGDWEVEYTGSCSYRHIGAATRESAPIALVTGGLSRADDIVIDANARLIAAAPDLYEALQELVDIRTIKDKLDEPNNGEWPDIAELTRRTKAAWAAARAALANVSPQAVSENGNVQGVK